MKSFILSLLGFISATHPGRIVRGARRVAGAHRVAAPKAPDLAAWMEPLLQLRQCPEPAAHAVGRRGGQCSIGVFRCINHPAASYPNMSILSLRESAVCSFKSKTSYRLP